MTRFVLDCNYFQRCKPVFNYQDMVIPVKPVWRFDGFGFEVEECDVRRDVYGFLCWLNCSERVGGRLVFYLHLLPFGILIKRVR